MAIRFPFTKDELLLLSSQPRTVNDDGLSRPLDTGRVMRVIYMLDVLGLSLREAAEEDGITYTSVHKILRRWSDWAKAQKPWKRVAREAKEKAKLSKAKKKAA